MSKVRAQLADSPLETGTLGPASVLSSIAIVIPDGYEAAIESINHDIDTLETAVFAPGDNHHSESIYKLKKQIADFRRAAVPLARGLEELVNGDVPVFATVPDRYWRW